MLSTLLSLFPVFGAGAVIGLAQTKVRERSEKAALAMTAGAGLDVAYTLLGAFVHHELLWSLSTLVHTAALVGVGYGVFELFDATFPKTGRALPPALAMLAPYKPNLFVRGFFGLFGVVAILRQGLHAPLLGALAIAALALVLFASYWVDRQGPLWKLVLERQPELLAWGYVHQLRVRNRNTGATSVHWSAQLGLSNGAVVPISANDEEHARVLIAAVLELKPNIILGYSPENAARFQEVVKAAKAS